MLWSGVRAELVRNFSGAEIIMKREFDLIILGMGSTAASAGREARKLGKTVAYVEEGQVGGTCLNQGCVPSKFLIEAAKAFHRMKSPNFDALSCTEPLLDFERLIEQKDEIIVGYREAKEEKVLEEDDGIELFRGTASFIGPRTIKVGEDIELSGHRILIATGAKPSIPDIEGLDSVDHMTSDLLSTRNGEELRKLPESLIVVGGGYIALELGQMFSRLGTRVTILERSSQLLAHGYEPELGDALGRCLEEEGVSVICDCEVLSVHTLQESGSVEVIVKVAGEERTSFNAEKLLVATGRDANVERLALGNAGVELNSNGFIKVDRFLRTTRDGVFAAGDVIGKEQGNQMATPVGVADGKIAVKNAFMDRVLEPLDHGIIPRAIFTEPEIAMVGYTTDQLNEEGIEYSVSYLSMASVPRAVYKQEKDGFIKLLVDSERKILGATMFGASAGEVIQSIAFAMNFGADERDLIEQFYIYPTMAESLKFVAAAK